MTDLTNLAKDKLKNDNGFVSANNYNILFVSENYCEMEAVMSNASFNPFGIAHGGYVFGFADTAAGIAAMTDERTAVTISANIEYLKSGKGSKLIAKAKALKTGKSISVIEVFIYDEEDNLIAKANFNYFYLN